MSKLMSVSSILKRAATLLSLLFILIGIAPSLTPNYQHVPDSIPLVIYLWHLSPILVCGCSLLFLRNYQGCWPVMVMCIAVSISSWIIYRTKDQGLFHNMSVGLMPIFINFLGIASGIFSAVIGAIAVRFNDATNRKS